MPTPPAPSRPDLVRGLQERAARALPAEYVEHLDGWWLRHTTGSAWWAGTVLPHGDAARLDPGGPLDPNGRLAPTGPLDLNGQIAPTGPLDLRGRVAAVEKFYAGYAAAPRFQITPGTCPSGLDPLLAERGYRRESPMTLRCAPTTAVLAQAPTGSLRGSACASTGPLRVRVDDHPTSAWFDVWHAVHGQGAEPRSEWDLLGRVNRHSAYACALSDGEVIAVSRAVADEGWAGVFGMATIPRARGKGAARAVLAALADWAGSHEAHRMYLQVERDNAPALRLYDRAGFGEVCGYHYRGGAG
ncbi:GNAT family N-acetyltransferase [Streptomyces sp. NPDC002055]|uniref:GNAT family N-acetyltransferase n=1 Tax=Streptomyces sp. NPDC002055 TaxID=3154534 RepID=UPI003321300A